MATKPISTFFSKKSPSGSTKRKADESDRPESGKKAATEAESGSTLSPAEKARVSASKQAALAARAKKTGVPSPGLVAESWAKALKPEFEKPYFPKLMAFLGAENAKGAPIYPPADEVYSWSDACDFKDVKVVILGQDPYHGPGEAHGLCFSVKEGVKIPPSLRNMYKELATDIPGFVAPKHGYLQSWSEQGVVLLNAVLTVKHKTPNSHKNQGWEKFTDAIISSIDKQNSNVVFVLWGNYAKKKGKNVDKKKHCVIEGTHPSPLSAYGGFFGCKHFSKANEYLKKQGRTPINWKSVMDA